MGRYGVNNGWYGPMVTRYTGPMVTRCIGGLSQLPEVKMSWGKKSEKKLSVLTKFSFLVNFIRHTGPLVTIVTTGPQAHRWPISASSGQNELGKKF